MQQRETPLQDTDQTIVYTEGTPIKVDRQTQRSHVHMILAVYLLLWVVTMVSANSIVGETCGFVPPLQNYSNIVYAQGYGRQYELDFGGPSSTEKRPLAIIVHGGGFKTGSKCSNTKLAAIYMARGYRTASINYPLCADYFDGTGLHEWGATAPLSGDPPSACVSDAKPDYVEAAQAEIASRAVQEAVAYLHARADELHIDTSKTVCHGSSAGAYTCSQTLFINSAMAAQNLAPFAADVSIETHLPPAHDEIRLNVGLTLSGSLLTTSGTTLTQAHIDAMAPGGGWWGMGDPLDLGRPELAAQGGHLGLQKKFVAELDRVGVPNLLVEIEGGGLHGVALIPNITGQVQEDMFTFIQGRFDSDLVATVPPETPTSAAAIAMATILLSPLLLLLQLL